MLGASRFWQHLSGLRHQLRTSWMSSSLVRAVADSFSALATGAPTMLTDRAPPARLSAASLSMITKYIANTLMIRAGKMPTLRPRTRVPNSPSAQLERIHESRLHRETQIGEQFMSELKQRGIALYNWFERRLGLGAACH